MIEDYSNWEERSSSIWWRDIRLIGVHETNAHDNWFSSSISFKLGDGKLIYFWHDIWVGTNSFSSLFLELFAFAKTDCERVNDNGFWRDNCWIWQPIFTVNFASFSQVVMAEFLELWNILQHVQPKIGNSDIFVWWRHPYGFSVKASYG